MKKSFLLLPIILLSCKNPDFGSKVRDFAYNESFELVNSLSKKDLEMKWYNYHFNMIQYGLASINKANFIMQNMDMPDVEGIEKDTIKLMKVSYMLDKQIQVMYEVNEDIYNAGLAYKKSLNACSDNEIFKIYTDNRSYLFNSLQMAMPQFNFSYSAQVTFSTGDQNSRKNDDTGIDAIPLIGNISTFFSQKKIKEQKEKFEEGQNYINNIRLNEAELHMTSSNICEVNRSKFNETLNILRDDVEIQKSNFVKIYSSLIKLRDALAPIVIKNIVAQFSSEDLLIYKVKADTEFTNRMAEMYQTSQLLTFTGELKTAVDFEQVETKLDMANEMIAELEVLKNSILGIKNQKLIAAMTTSLNNKRLKLLELTDGRLK